MMNKSVSKNRMSKSKSQLGDTISDNISDITYRHAHAHGQCFRRDCCKERDKILERLHKKNSKKVSQVRLSGNGPLL